MQKKYLLCMGMLTAIGCGGEDDTAEVLSLSDAFSALEGQVWGNSYVVPRYDTYGFNTDGSFPMVTWNEEITQGGVSGKIRNTMVWITGVHNSSFPDQADGSVAGVNSADYVLNPVDGFSDNVRSSLAFSITTSTYDGFPAGLVLDFGFHVMDRAKVGNNLVPSEAIWWLSDTTVDVPPAGVGLGGDVSNGATYHQWCSSGDAASLCYTNEFGCGRCWDGVSLGTSGTVGVCSGTCGDFVPEFL